MKKILLIFILIFSFITVVFADDNLLINELKITNGEIAPKFDRYNNYYSVTIDNNTKSLEFEYEYDTTNYDIKVINNENLVANKLIYVTVFNKSTNEQNTYIFKIYIEETDTTANVENENNETDLKVETKKNTNYAPIVGAICFILIILVYYVIFLR